MRKEASLEQWKVLYEAATRIEGLKPWEKFWDLDLIGVRNGSEDETTFFCIHGRDGARCGISVYEGFTGLNSFLMLALRQRLNVTTEYAMFYQRNMSCYWGMREDLTERQRKVIKDLGYKYRGKNQWLYFQSRKPGYSAYILDEEEALRMADHLQDLELALRCYEESGAEVSFEKGSMFLLTFEEDKKKWHYGEAPLPFAIYQYRNLLIQDEELIAKLEKASNCGAVLEADISIPGGTVTDREYDRPMNPALALLGDVASEAVLKFEMLKPEDNPTVRLAEMVVEFILQNGAPKEIRVSNVIIEAGLEQICNICGIRLCRTMQLPVLEAFAQSMKRFDL